MNVSDRSEAFSVISTPDHVVIGEALSVPAVTAPFCANVNVSMEKLGKTGVE